MRRKNISKSLVFKMLLILALIASNSTAKAESDASTAKRSLKTIKAEVRKLKKLINKNGVRSALVKASVSYKDFKDGDSDGLPDILENVEGTDSCGDDSDSDGISDGDEGKSGSRPDDSSSSEVETKNTISAITDTTVTVGAYTFTVTETTIFKKASGLSSFHVGDLVEASGRIDSGVLFLKKLSLED